MVPMVKVAIVWDIWKKCMKTAPADKWTQASLDPSASTVMRTDQKRHSETLHYAQFSFGWRYVFVSHQLKIAQNIYALHRSSFRIQTVGSRARCPYLFWRKNLHKIIFFKKIVCFCVAFYRGIRHFIHFINMTGRCPPSVVYFPHIRSEIIRLNGEHLRRKRMIMWRLICSTIREFPIDETKFHHLQCWMLAHIWNDCETKKWKTVELPTGLADLKFNFLLISYAFVLVDMKKNRCEENSVFPRHRWLSKRIFCTAKKSKWGTPNRHKQSEWNRWLKTVRNATLLWVWLLFMLSEQSMRCVILQSIETKQQQQQPGCLVIHLNWKWEIEAFSCDGIV